MHFPRRFFVLFCLFALPFAWAQEEMKLNLSDALKLAIENNLDLKLERLNVTNSDLNLRDTRSRYEPEIDGTLSFSTQDSEASNQNEGNAGATFSQDETQMNVTFSKAEDFGFSWQINNRNVISDSTSAISLGETYRSTITLGFSQQLLKDYAFNKEIALKDEYVARGNHQISKFDLQEKIISTIEQTEQAYWNLVLAIEQQKVNVNSLKLAQQLYDQNKIKIEVGTLAPIELVNSEASVAEREATLVSGANAIRAAEDALKKIMNLSIDQWDAQIVPTQDPLATNIDKPIREAFDLALQNRIEVQREDVRTQNAVLELKYSENQLLPELRVDGGYTSVGVDSGQESALGDALSEAASNDFPGWSVSLITKWKPFNKTAKISKAKAQVSLRRQELQTELLRKTILEEVRKALRELKSNQESMNAREKALKFREESLKAEVQKFQNGLTTNYQVSQVQDDLTQARLNLLEAKINYTKSILAYYKSVGKLTEERGIHLD